MVTVDQCLKKTTVKRETLEILKDTLDEAKPSEKIDLRSQNKEDIIKLYVRGYWLTRFLLESQPKLLKNFLGKRYSDQELESKISAVYGIDPEMFWKEIEGRVLEHFEQYKTDKSV